MIVFKNPLPYDIRISGSANGGFILQAGCCTCVFTDQHKMLVAIENYINDPEKMEAEYNKSRKGCEPVPMPDPGYGYNRLAGGTGPVNQAVEECMDEGPNDCGPNCDCRR